MKACRAGLQLVFTFENRFFFHHASYSLLPARPGYMLCQAKCQVCWSVETSYEEKKQNPFVASSQLHKYTQPFRKKSPLFVKGSYSALYDFST
jgi:hypothetical protein